jgi:hypothetical protein
MHREEGTPTLIAGGCGNFLCVCVGGGGEGGGVCCRVGLAFVRSVPKQHATANTPVLTKSGLWLFRFSWLRLLEAALCFDEELCDRGLLCLKQK